MGKFLLRVGYDALDSTRKLIMTAGTTFLIVVSTLFVALCIYLIRSKQPILSGRTWGSLTAGVFLLAAACYGGYRDLRGVPELAALVTPYPKAQLAATPFFGNTWMLATADTPDSVSVFYSQAANTEGWNHISRKPGWIVLQRDGLYLSIHALREKDVTTIIYITDSKSPTRW